ncbi:hypothetical protein X798_03726 [Onchocerca flexuosa]|uniref:Uncharacterized protein n=1 Tax=Onchocerca flexuosa TaxID=387005 RepID=A0A238BV88_9BILA|nr:hypothetical protein X798_03726 [Onchocerca flexuosa]
MIPMLHFQIARHVCNMYILSKFISLVKMNSCSSLIIACQVHFTEEDYESLSLNSISEILEILDKRLDLAELEGKTLEKELFAVMKQIISDGKKMTVLLSG